MFRFKNYKKISYAQSGEDIIVSFILKTLKIKHPTYIDIGAHHPFYLSNTAIFYKKGFSGVCIEPDPVLFKEIKKSRKRDICLNIGIGINDLDKADFFLMSTPSLNTFSKEEALNYDKNSKHKLKKVIKLPLKTINWVFEHHTNGRPDFVSIDVEGLDFDIIKSLDFERYRPTVLCIETLRFIRVGVAEKEQAIIDFVIKQGYMVYADTYINTIFVDKTTWSKRSR